MHALVVATFLLTMRSLNGQIVADTSLASVQQAILDQHNNARREIPSVAMLKLSWDTEVADRAQQWVNRCKYAHPVVGTKDLDTYLKTSKYNLGQNIARSGKVKSWSDMINLWYSEISSFTLGTKTSAVVGHYTQMMWNTTFLLGCGYKDCGTFHFYACNYAPGGNIAGLQFSPYVAGTACEKCQTACEDGLCTNPCPYTNKYCNCDKSCQGSSALFPKGCEKAPSYLKSQKSYCAATCNCAGTKLY